MEYWVIETLAFVDDHNEEQVYLALWENKWNREEDIQAVFDVVIKKSYTSPGTLEMFKTLKVTWKVHMEKLIEKRIVTSRPIKQ